MSVVISHLGTGGPGVVSFTELPAVDPLTEGRNAGELREVELVLDVGRDLHTQAGPDNCRQLW